MEYSKYPNPRFSGLNYFWRKFCKKKATKNKATKTQPGKWDEFRKVSLPIRRHFPLERSPPPPSPLPPPLPSPLTVSMPRGLVLLCAALITPSQEPDPPSFCSHDPTIGSKGEKDRKGHYANLARDNSPPPLGRMDAFQILRSVSFFCGCACICVCVCLYVNMYMYMCVFVCVVIGVCARECVPPHRFGEAQVM